MSRIRMKTGAEGGLDVKQSGSSALAASILSSWEHDSPRIVNFALRKSIEGANRWLGATVIRRISVYGSSRI